MMPIDHPSPMMRDTWIYRLYQAGRREKSPEITESKQPSLYHPWRPEINRELEELGSGEGMSTPEKLARVARLLEEGSLPRQPKPAPVPRKPKRRGLPKAKRAKAGKNKTVYRRKK